MRDWPTVVGGLHTIMTEAQNANVHLLGVDEQHSINYGIYSLINATSHSLRAKKSKIMANLNLLAFTLFWFSTVSNSIITSHLLPYKRDQGKT